MFGARRPKPLTVEEAGRRVLSGDLAVGEAARLTGRTKAEIATAVEHAIYMQSRIGLEDARRLRKSGRGRWILVLAGIALLVEGAAAAIVFRFDTRSEPLPTLARPNRLPSAALTPTAPAPPRASMIAPAATPGSTPGVGANCAMDDAVRRALAAYCGRLIDAATRSECRCMR